MFTLHHQKTKTKTRRSPGTKIYKGEPEINIKKYKLSKNK